MKKTKKGKAATKERKKTDKVKSFEQNVLFIGNETESDSVCFALGDLNFRNIHKVHGFDEAMGMLKIHCYRLVLIRLESWLKDRITNLCLVIRFLNIYTITMVLMSEFDTDIEGKLFDCGVNDVIVEPSTTPNILVKRINTRLQSTNALQPESSNVIWLKNVLIDFDRREIICGGETRNLPTGKTYELLMYFIDNSNRIVTRDELQESIWPEYSPDNEVIDVTVSKLRKTIEPDISEPKTILSIRDEGWKFIK